jgi:hypothetical protein
MRRELRHVVKEAVLIRYCSGYCAKRPPWLGSLRILTGQLQVANGLVTKVEASRGTAICSGCGETKTRFHDLKPARAWRHLDAWGVATYIRAALRHVRCRHCGVRVEQVPWARTRSRFTHAFETEVLTRARDTSIAGVCLGGSSTRRHPNARRAERCASRLNQSAKHPARVSTQARLPSWCALYRVTCFVDCHVPAMFASTLTRYA